MTNILLAVIAIALLLLVFVVLWLAIVSRVNDLDRELQEDEHAADLPQVPPPTIDFRGMRLFND